MLRSSAYLGGLFTVLSFGLWGCSTPEVGRLGERMSFHDTRLQFAVLTNDRAALQQVFKMQPDRTVVERVIASAQLPFSAAIETVTWPLSYGLSAHLDHTTP